MGKGAVGQQKRVVARNSCTILTFALATYPSLSAEASHNATVELNQLPVKGFEYEERSPVDVAFPIVPGQSYEPG